MDELYYKASLSEQYTWKILSIKNLILAIFKLPTLVPSNKDTVPSKKMLLFFQCWFDLHQWQIFSSHYHLGSQIPRGQRSDLTNVTYLVTRPNQNPGLLSGCSLTTDHNETRSQLIHTNILKSVLYTIVSMLNSLVWITVLWSPKKTSLCLGNPC